jgi:hypothetical protein
MPAVFDCGFNSCCVELTLRLTLWFCFGFAYGPAQIRARWRRVATPIIPLLLHQVGNLQGVAKSLVLHNRA